MKSVVFTLVVLFIAVSAQSAYSQSAKENVKKVAGDLEAGVYTKEAISDREKALKWVIETDEVHLIACGGTFGPFVDKKNKNGSDMVAAYMIGMAAFRIDNATADEDAVQLAGVELALKVYDRLVKEKPKTKYKSVDEMVAKRDTGQLSSFVKAAECGKK